MFNHLFGHLNKSQVGMILALVGFTSYAFSDICAKWLVMHYSSYQAIAINNGFACCFLLLALPWLGGVKAFKEVRYKRLHALRSLLNIAISLIIMHIFTLLPIADIYTFIFAVPLYASLLAIPLYGEHITRNRLIAIIVGFGGVILALQPEGGNFDLNLLWALACGVLIAVMLTITKSMQGESLFSMGFWPILTNVVVCSVLILNSEAGMQPVATGDLLLFALNGLLLTIGILTISNAFRIAPAAVVSPFLYTEMIWAILFGYLIFGDVPNGGMLAGAGVIILSGFYLIETERKSGRRNKA